MKTNPGSILSRRIRIIHLEDDPLDREWVAAMLAEAGILFEIIPADNPDAFQEALKREKADLIISDFSIPSYDGARALRASRQMRETVPFIFFSGTIGEEAAIESLKMGATDYVLKQHPDRLVAAVRRALTEADERTARRHAEEELHRRDLLLRQIMENVEDLITVVDLEGRRVLDSPSHIRFFGEKAPAVGADFLAEVYPADRECVHDAFLKTISTGTGQRVEYRLVIPGGGVRDMDARCSLIRDENDRGNYALWVSHDITADKRAAEKIREQAALLDEARDAICVNDLDQVVLFWNKSAERLYGWTARQARGRNANELLLQGEVALTAMKTLIQCGEWHGELHQTTRAGVPLIVESRWTLIRDSSGKPKSILVINTDITEKKQIEARLLSIQRMENLGALAGGVAHDLNNILAPIMMAAEIIRDDPGGKSSGELLEMIGAGARRGSDLVHQILSFTRGARDGMTPLQLHRVVSEVMQLIGSTFPRSIALSVSVPRDLPAIRGHVTQLHQVLLNLCVNARDAMPDGGTLTIEAALVQLDHKKTSMFPGPLSGPYVEIKIEDTGTGIAPELMSKIFEPLFTTKEPGKGTGLGLSTVLSIVKSHDGFIEVSSQQRRGTTFRVYFPVLGEIAAMPGDTPEVKPMHGRGEQILIVEDEIAIMEITSTTLEAYNYRVLTAKNGFEAVEIFSRHHAGIDLVVTDMMMPGMDGPALVQAMRNINPGVKFVAVSGLSELNSDDDLPKENVKAFLGKPYTTSKLLATLRSVLDA